MHSTDTSGPCCAVRCRLKNLDPAALHKMLIQQKYRLLFSPKRVRRPGPKESTKDLIDAVVEMKRRNRTWGCKRIAQQIALAFGVDIGKTWSVEFRNTLLCGSRIGRPLLALYDRSH